jgi:hypothetical protein
MTITQLIILQFIAHLLADFTFQPQHWCNKKEKEIITRHHIYHILIVFATSYILSFDIGFWKAALFLTFLHFLIDVLKSWIIITTRIKYVFFIDQLLHLITIAGIVWLYKSFYGIDFLFEMETISLAVAAGFLLCAKPANIIIKFVLQAFEIETPVDDQNDSEGKSLPNAGKLIGITERFLALALILLGQYEAVGLIIAAKSILRFRDTKKSEYVLAGTLLSFGIATLAGLVIKMF